MTRNLVIVLSNQNALVLVQVVKEGCIVPSEYLLHGRAIC